MEPGTKIIDIIADIERLRTQAQGKPDWYQLTYADEASDTSISSSGTLTAEEWEAAREWEVERAVSHENAR